MVTVADIAALLGVDPVAEQVNLQAAIDATRVRDADGRAPSDPDWAPTSDLYLAAAAYVEAWAVRRAIGMDGEIQEFASEGSRFKIATLSAADLRAMAKHLRSLSPLVDSSMLSVVEIDNGGDWFPRSHFQRRWPQWT